MVSDRPNASTGSGPSSRPDAPTLSPHAAALAQRLHETITMAPQMPANPLQLAQSFGGSFGPGDPMAGLAGAFQGFLKDSLAQQKELFNRVHEHDVLAHKTASYLNDSVDKLTVLAGVIASSASGGGSTSKAVSGRTVATAGGSVTQSPKAASGGGGGVTVAGGRRASGESPRTQRMHRSGMSGSGIVEGEDDDYEDSYEARKWRRMQKASGRGVSMRDIIAGASDSAAQRFGAWESKDHLAMTQAPMMIPTPIGNFPLGPGVVVDPRSQQMVSPDRANNFANHARWAKLGTNVASGFSQAYGHGASIGQSLMSGLRGASAAEGVGALGPIAGGAALAVGGVLAAGKTWQVANHAIRSQVQANNEWRAITGGGQGEAIGNRLSAEGFKLGALFDPMSMGSGDRERLMMGVSRAGYRGGAAQGMAQGFGMSNYNKYGMGAQESLELINTAAKNGNMQLSGLASSLEAVTKAARQSGVAVDEARKGFSQMYEIVAGQLGGAGGGSAILAGAMTQYKSSLGVSMQDVSFSGAFDQNQIRRRAALNGLNPMQQAFQNPLQQAAAVDKGRAEASNQILQAGGKQLIAQWAQENKIDLSTKKTLSDGEQNSLAAYLGSRGIGQDAAHVADVIRNYTGIQVDSAQDGMKLIIGGFLDPNAASTAAKEVEGALAPVQISGGRAGLMGNKAARDVISRMSAGHAKSMELASLSFEEARKRSDELSKAGIDIPSSEADWKVTQKKIEDNLFVHDREGGIFGASKGAKINNQERSLARSAAKTGVYSPYAAKAIAAHDTSMRLKVSLGDGKYAKVSLREANDYFYDQVVSGEAQIVEGAGAGQSLAEFGGGQVLTPEQMAKFNLSKSDGKTHVGGGSDQNKKFDEYTTEDEQEDAKKGVTGKITVEATDELRTLLRFNTSGNVRNSASANGTPPTTNVKPSERQGG